MRGHPPQQGRLQWFLLLRLLGVLLYQVLHPYLGGRRAR